LAEREQEILRKSEELKEMIDKQTKSLLNSLDEIKNRHLKEIQTFTEMVNVQTVLVSLA